MLDKIRKLKENSKKKSLILIGVYALFFLFVFIIIIIGENSTSNYTSYETETKKTLLEQYSDYNSYDYNIKYIFLDKEDVFIGTYYNNKTIFTYNNIKYYYDGVNYYVDKNNLNNKLNYGIEKLFNNNLKTIINELTYISKTEYTDGTIEKNYTYDSDKFYYYIFNTNTTYNSNINIKIKENDDNIVFIFDLSSFNISLKSIEITYTNIDKINNLDIDNSNYEMMVIE